MVAKSQDGYTNLTSGVLHGLYEARASGREVIAYARLVRFHRDAEHPARCWASAQMAGEELGMSADVFRKALNALTRKTFSACGVEVPVLTRISCGHNGRSTVYNDNLYALAVLRDPTQVAGQICPPRVFNTAESSRTDTATYSDRVGGQKRPSSRTDLSTHTRELNSSRALPPAMQCAAYDVPTYPDTTSRVGTGEDAPRAAAGALGERAAAQPSRDEYERIARKLVERGLDAITEEEREAYHAGHPLYAAT